MPKRSTSCNKSTAINSNNGKQSQSKHHTLSLWITVPQTQADIPTWREIEVDRKSRLIILLLCYMVYQTQRGCNQRWNYSAFWAIAFLLYKLASQYSKHILHEARHDKHVRGAVYWQNCCSHAHRWPSEEQYKVTLKIHVTSPNVSQKD